MKPKIAIVAGGYSDEDVISYQSGEMVSSNLPNDVYEIYSVSITKEKWFVKMDEKEIIIDKNDFSFFYNEAKINFDAVFIAVHGTPGEDGKLQGYFDMLNIPYSTCSASVAALTFNKSYTNRVLQTFGIKTAPAVLINKKNKFSVKEIIPTTGLPCFVKPNAAGSSLGISKVYEETQLFPAIEKAFEQGVEVIIEKFIEGKEITCGVVNWKGELRALGITEIVSTNDFFDYDAKYHNKGTEEITPARITKEEENICYETSKKIYRLLNGKGIVRVDYMLSEDGLYVIELNTVPGLSERSLIPQQAEYSGISLSELFSNSIEEMLGEF